MGEVILLGRTQCQFGLTKGQRRSCVNCCFSKSLLRIHRRFFIFERTAAVVRMVWPRRS